MATISHIQADSILDSRGVPTVQVQIFCENGASAIAHASSNPNSTAIHNYVTRDGDPNFYKGAGVNQAIQLIKDRISPELIGKELTNQLEIDQLLQQLDNTPNFSSLGTNVVYPISVAVCKVAALNDALPIYRYINLLNNHTPLTTPIPIASIISGGHRGAHNNIDLEEFLIIPQNFVDLASTIRAITEIYATARQLLIDNRAILGTSDDGGLSPNLFSDRDAFELLKQSVIQAGYSLNQQIMLGLRVGAQHLYKGQLYLLRDNTQGIDAPGLLNHYADLIQQFPIIYLEDLIANDDWAGWAQATSELGSKVLIAASDIYASDADQFNRLKEQSISNTAVVIPRLAGTVTNTLNLVQNIKQSGRRVVISSELGDTEDAFLADLAVGASSDFVKFGAPAHAEQTAKYNRLIQISHQL